MRAPPRRRGGALLYLYMREIWTRKDLTERTRMFLAASVGEMSVTEACQKLGITDAGLEGRRQRDAEEVRVGSVFEAVRSVKGFPSANRQLAPPGTGSR